MARLGAVAVDALRVVLDGVFNHVSADSPWFDRFRNYEAVGACESVDSPYRDWFYLSDEVRAGRRAISAYPSRPCSCFFFNTVNMSWVMASRS